MSDPAALRVRASTPDDVAAIARIYGHHVRTGFGSFELEPPEPAEIARRWNAVVAGGLPFLVAERGGNILGYAYAGPHHPRTGYRHTLETSVYVAPEALGQGVGRTLLAALIEAATRLGYRQMVAVIGDGANRASIALHAGAGFRAAGTLAAIGRKHGRWLDVVLMQRALGEGDATDPEAI